MNTIPKHVVIVVFLLLCNGFVRAQTGKERLNQLINAQTESLGSFLPADTFTAFTRLHEMVGDKTIVGIGEATHGTKECLQAFMNIATRLIRFNDFKIIILAESEFSDTRALNDYVVNGKGDAISALRYIRHFPEMRVEYDLLPLVEWVRNYNLTQTPANKVWMMGAENKGMQGVAEDALSFIRQTNMPVADTFKQVLAVWANLSLGMMNEYPRMHPLEELEPQFTAFRKAASLYEGDAQLKQSVEQIEYSLRIHYMKYGPEKVEGRTIVRDSCMYDNIKWIKTSRPGAKIIVYAHNAHVQKGILYAVGKEYTSFGYLLDQQFPGQYYTIGTDLMSGTFEVGSGIAPITESDDKFAAILHAATGKENGIFYFQQSETVKKYFNKKHYMTWANLSSTKSKLQAVTNITTDFDALYFAKLSTPVTLAPAWDSTARFGLGFKLTDAMKEDIKTNGFLQLEIKSVINTPEIRWPGTGVSVALLLQGNSKLVDLKAQVIDSTTCTTRFLVPPGYNPENLILALYGNNISSMQLQEVAVNGHVMDLQSLNAANVNVFNQRTKVEYYKTQHKDNGLVIQRVDGSLP
ncbi:erythromycin esterase family protein [Chitinophaga sp. Cy-1792]|uniref:erythromycin esterase family protein n=1 Tax=Chitinophaga sp. Cy-1792 TaxID=2608339 RepID=UPI001421B424|nr:erythromycin esterase family protein [Chitinophaga sp. Cy-1792]NIG54540.1 erythromycin esterase family protein [Chitinophaga sp. Cy-1792]